MLKQYGNIDRKESSNMKTVFKVYEEEKDKHKEEVQEVYLRLEEDSNGILLSAIDKRGEAHPAGSILRINKDGTLSRLMYMSKKLGLQQEEGGCIRLIG